MRPKALSLAAAVVAAAVLLSTAALAAPSISAQSAIVLDGCTGRVLYEKSADTRSLIASTTKIMTALIVLESCDIDARVRIPAEACGIEGSSLYLKPGEVLSVRELLLGLMLQSGNDAAMALALYCGGTREAFVQRMNDRAAQLGLENTRFANPHGLDDEQNYSTARDMARLAAIALERDDFREIVSTKSALVAGRSLTNHNKLLWRVDGAVGVKTGYTRAAGRILVGAAERGGRRLICVTINAPSDWADHAALLDFGFSEFTQQPVVTAGETVGEVPVLSGDRGMVRAASCESFSYPLAAGEEIGTVLRLPRFVFAPVMRGEAAGTAEFYLAGRLIGSVPLHWAESAFDAPEPPGLLRRIFGR